MICVPVFERTVEAATEAMKQAAEQADVIELRLDAMPPSSLPALLENRPPRPVIVTARTPADGGQCLFKEPQRLGLLHQALELGADYIDIELRTGPEAIKRLVEAKNKSSIIVSWHTFANTPTRKILRARMRESFDAGADVCKLVTLALFPQDNGRLLEVVATAAQREKKQVIGFCMGDLGRFSRLATLFLGGMWTYAYLKTPVAPGMMSVEETRRYLSEFGWPWTACATCPAPRQA